MTIGRLIYLPFRTVWVLLVLVWLYASAAVEHIGYWWNDES